MFGHDWERSQLRRAAYRKRADRLKAARELGTHTDFEWFALALVIPYCAKCGSRDKKIGKDHIVPICHGGDDSIENIQPLCQSCNSAKGPDDTDHRPPDWRGKVAAILEFSRTQ